MTIASAIQEAAQRLKTCGIESSPELDARLILSHVLDKDPFHLLLNIHEDIPPEKKEDFSRLIKIRETGMPCAYILGKKEFWSLEFTVNRFTLIPRPETELLVEEGIRITRENAWRKPKILDLGTGSGAIAISLAREIQEAMFVATDISLDALLVAKENAQKHNVISRFHFLQTDWVTTFKTLKENDAFHMVVANPPYIGEEERKTLDMTSLKYEPLTALFSGKDGLDAIRNLLLQVPKILRPSGWFLCEIGYMQGEKAVALAKETGNYKHIEILKGLCAHDRVLKAQKNMVFST